MEFIIKIGESYLSNWLLEVRFSLSIGIQYLCVYNGVKQKTCYLIVGAIATVSYPQFSVPL